MNRLIVKNIKFTRNDYNAFFLNLPFSPCLLAKIATWFWKNKWSREIGCMPLLILKKKWPKLFKNQTKELTATKKSLIRKLKLNNSTLKQGFQEENQWVINLQKWKMMIFRPIGRIIYWKIKKWIMLLWFWMISKTRT